MLQTTTTAHNASYKKLGSSLRTKRAEETIALASKFGARLGITRVTDITRMDRLGLPVFASIRPRGQTLRVHAGKGLTHQDAEVGAWMEAVEYAVAEPQATNWVQRSIKISEIAHQFVDGMKFVDFVPRSGIEVSSNAEVTCVQCEELRTSQKYWIPAQLIFIPLTYQHEPNLFGGTTNGLASGNSIDEASLHALLEVLERDCISLNKARDRSIFVNPDSFPAPFSTMQNAWRKLGVFLTVRRIPNVFDLPCYQAMLHEPSSATINLSTGFGLHIDSDIALTRAITEAAQSRLSHIQGSRDDVTFFYSKYGKWESSFRNGLEASIVSTFTSKALSEDYFDSEATSNFFCIEEVLASLMNRLSQKGFHNVFRYCFASPIEPLYVVKIVVPKCEHVEHNVKRVGPRLLRAILG